MSFRATLALDDDVAADLEAERRGLSLEETVNEVLRQNLAGVQPPSVAPPKPYRIQARPLHARSGLDFDDIGGLLDQIDPPKLP